MRASAIGLMNKIDLAPAMLAQMVSDLMKREMQMNSSG